jgi:hypothetical protein
MRRSWMTCALCVLMTCAVAWGSSLVPPTSTHPGVGRYALSAYARNGSLQPAKRSSRAGAFLLGNRVVKSGRDQDKPGEAEAFPFRSSATGTLTSVRVYIDGRNRAKSVAVGLYTNRRGHPGRRVAAGVLKSTKARKWNALAVRSSRVVAGHTYWIALLAQGGQLQFRDRIGAGCSSEDFHRSRISSLPKSWRPGRKWPTCKVSAYGAGWRLSGPSPKPPGGSGSSPGPSSPPGGSPTPPPPAGGSSGSSVPCPLTSAAASCWATHTGVPGYSEAQILAGQTPLTHVVGDVTVTVPGTVISNDWIDGCVSIRASNVTIQNSLIHTTHSCKGGDNRTASSAINDGGGSSPTGLMIKNTEVDGMNGAGDTYGVTAVNYTCDHCNVHGFTKNLEEIDNVVIVDTYAHDLNTNDQCSHANVVFDDTATNSSVEHSYLDASGTSSGCITAAFNFETDWGPGNNLTLNNSYLAGHDGADISGGCDTTNFRVTNDAFSSNNGYSGTDYANYFNAKGVGNVWSGNYVPELGNAPAPPPKGNIGSDGC